MKKRTEAKSLRNAQGMTLDLFVEPAGLRPATQPPGLEPPSLVLRAWGQDSLEGDDADKQTALALIQGSPHPSRIPDPGSGLPPLGRNGWPLSICLETSFLKWLGFLKKCMCLLLTSSPQQLGQYQPEGRLERRSGKAALGSPPSRLRKRRDTDRGHGAHENP